MFFKAIRKEKGRCHNLSTNQANNPKQKKPKTEETETKKPAYHGSVLVFIFRYTLLTEPNRV